VVDPLEALERVAYLQDRGLLPSQKTAAFLRAAEVVRALPAGELERRVADGTLLDLPAIGEHRRGHRPGARGPRARPHRRPRGQHRHPARGGPRGARGAAGDCHSHSTWSDGGASIETMARAAMALGHEYLVVTDHSPRLTVAHGLDRGRLRAQLDEIAALNERSRRSGSSPASRSTSSSTARSTRTSTCSTASTSWSPRCTPSSAWSRGT
jgi:putative hydrolase